ncbi:CDP-glycerol glycerophosphotransferase family protein [Streptomyces sp. NBC_00841]|uniref:bifunctional glycosyltransferase/CDP-glycerol:glycerophosphate glycerophosphotransferase n=1 Tax=Streptomyces sp. NBC_00841 TaxID=2975847 RepID=UPI002DD9BBF1|nr:CDP-glycerol glycerophosphotransferase family protein [Streptomyces sp. NBC_00841]WRZ99911.1 CDP-glycerol glycerophosphotransferase family protein [Streptomyces sp. NBC_00841]
MKPRLSVVVPVHNVEEYLEPCLRSVAEQSVGAIEVVLVDDGSTDGSTAIAEAFAAHDQRFRYVRQPNAGLSAARNAGVRHTTPGVPYLAFADSDDIVVHDAYERMLASLESTGSDLATGNVWRLTEQGRQQAWQYRWLTGTRARTHISRDPRLLADRVAWNKVFRRSFWDRHAFAFPEGKLYEDTPVMIPAHFLAGSVDVLHEHVYYWRVREGSITRRRTDVKGVRDRIAACEQVSAFLGGREANRGARHRYDASCLRDDFVYFLEGLPMGGPEYRDAFMAGAGAFLDRAGPAVLDELPVELRIKWQLVRERRTAELLSVLDFERANGAGTFAVTGVPGRRRAAFPGVPESARPARTDFPAVARLLGAEWGGDGKLRLRGYSYIRNLSASAPRHSLKMGMVRAARGTQLRTVPVRTVPAPEATIDSGQELHSYDRSGFELVLDPRRLRPGSWLVGVVVAGHGVVRRVAVRAVEAGAVQPLVHDLGDGRRAVLDYRGGRLQLTVAHLSARCEAHRTGHELELTGQLYGGARPKSLVLTCDGALESEYRYPFECRADERFTVRIPLADLARMADAPGPPHRAPHEVEAEPGGRWRARLILADGSRVPLPAAPDLPLPALADAGGELVLDLTGQPVVDRAEWTADGALRLGGAAGSVEGAPPLVLRHDALRETVTIPVAYEETSGGRRGAGRFTAFLAPSVAAGLHEGRWDSHLGGLPVRVLTALTARLPLRRKGKPGGPAREFTLDRRHGDRLTVHAGPVLAPAERGAYRQAALRGTYYPAQRALPLRDTVLYTGGDSPRAVHHELVRRGVEFEHLWVTDGRQGHLPPTAVPVVEHSTAWYEALARARRIVTADQLPEWFERRPGQTVVQTWHGAPLGRFGTDLTDSLYADHHHLASLPHRAAQWSVLVSPSSWATPHLRRALAYDGEVLEAGSPANDLLFAADREKTAERVRRRLGIPAGRQVVLYAPTYRDHLAHAAADAGSHRCRWDPALDPSALSEALGDTHSVLVRRHPRVTGSVPDGPHVRDVSAHPDTAELLLIADVLVTDYAGLMFDFAHTGRPMLFHTYDLEHYRDTVRGFCLDFETRAPGPLLVGTDEIARALGNPGTLAASTQRHAEAYESFRRDFCDLDDGGAAARVVDRLLAPQAAEGAVSSS